MLLRVLQEREVRRVGESLARRIDVRVIAATHRDLAQMVRAGTFRQDLFFRLAVAVVELPPLRERADDVVLIAESVLQRIAPDRRLTTRARAMLLGHSWPGNVRELENVLAVATTLTAGLIEPRHLELPTGHDEAPSELGDYHQRVESFRRRLVSEALEAAEGNRSEAARRLGLSRQPCRTSANRWACSAVAELAPRRTAAARLSGICLVFSCHKHEKHRAIGPALEATCHKL